MQILKETTKWSVPPGTFAIASSGKCVAFRPHNGEVKVFTKGLTFDRRGRSFQKVKDPELLLKAISRG